jgi:hypothetical protein
VLFLDTQYQGQKKIVNKNNGLLNFSGKAGHLPRINVVCWRLQGVWGPQDIDYLRFYRSLSSDKKRALRHLPPRPLRRHPEGVAQPAGGGGASRLEF